MMIVKHRKFMSFFGERSNSLLLLDVFRLYELEYEYAYLWKSESILEVAHELAAKVKWSPDKALVIAIPCTIDTFLMRPAERLILLIKNITLGELVDKTKKLQNMKAFL